MFKFFQREVQMPISNETKTIIEIESFIVKWYVKKGWHNDTIMHHKILLRKEDADAFADQLQKSADFIGAYIKIEVERV